MKYQKMGSKRRTDLKIWPSEVKNVEESDSDVKKSLAPPKSAENNEKPKTKNWKKIEKFSSVSFVRSNIFDNFPETLIFLKFQN